MPKTIPMGMPTGTACGMSVAAASQLEIDSLRLSKGGTSSSAVVATTLPTDHMRILPSA